MQLIMSRLKLLSISLLSTLFIATGCAPQPNQEPTQATAGGQADAASKWEGKLIQRPGTTPEDEKVYLVRDGKRHWVISGDWLKQHGYNFPADVKIIPADELAQVPLGDPIQ